MKWSNTEGNEIFRNYYGIINLPRYTLFEQGNLIIIQEQIKTNLEHFLIGKWIHELISHLNTYVHKHNTYKCSNIIT